LDFPNKEIAKFIERIGGYAYDGRLQFMGFTSSDTPSQGRSDDFGNFKGKDI